MAENSHHQTPHLITAYSGPLQALEKKFLSQQHDIENWFQTQWPTLPAPVYGSVDLRNAGFKLAPVDMNLFPAGFNNLNQAFLPMSIEAAKIAIRRFNPQAKKILLIPENHTRNQYYWQSVKTLLDILKSAEFEVKIGSLIPDLTVADVAISPMTRVGKQIVIDGFIPDIILLNNDLSDGIPDILQDLQHQIIPPAELGWSQRLKSMHFQHYATVSEEFAHHFKLDPWLIAPLFHHCQDVDFLHHENEAVVTQYVEELLQAIQKKYDEYDIQCKPFVVIKADSGTYGMAVIVVRSSQEVLSLNRKQRTMMAKTKGGQTVDRVIIQEGVYTFETWGQENAVAEPVVYLWGERVVGGFYRVHKERGVDENLNSPGMHFEPLAFAKSCTPPGIDPLPDVCQNRFYAYGVVARLSMLAAAKEMQAVMR